MAEYILMHKDVEVAHIYIDSNNGTIGKIAKVLNKEHMPVGTVTSGFVDGDKFRAWWSSRSIPASRDGLQDFLRTLGIGDVRVLLTKSMGLSLSDHYWIRPIDSDVSWREINFFDNDFSDDVGNALFGRKITRNIDLRSPDNTSDGVLKKRWKIVNGTRCLIKGSTAFRQEPFNEVMASRIMDALDIPHVDYDVIWISDRPYSICPDFIDERTELVSAHQIMTTKKKANDQTLYQHYVDCCKDLGIDVTSALDGMITVDYIIGNSDRHTNNFGLMRDPETLEWLKPAPIFDSGTSLGCDLFTREIVSQAGIRCKPFKDKFSDQIKLVSSFDWIDFDALESCYTDLETIMESSDGIIDQERKNAIMSFIGRRVENLRILADRSKLPA